MKFYNKPAFLEWERVNGCLWVLIPWRGACGRFWDNGCVLVLGLSGSYTGGHVCAPIRGLYTWVKFVHFTIGNYAPFKRKEETRYRRLPVLYFLCWFLPFLKCPLGRSLPWPLEMAGWTGTEIGIWVTWLGGSRLVAQWETVTQPAGDIVRPSEEVFWHSEKCAFLPFSDRKISHHPVSWFLYPF